jgi:hypothetical protein
MPRNLNEIVLSWIYSSLDKKCSSRIPSPELCLFTVLPRNENPIYVFPEKVLRGLSHDFHIDVSVIDLNISRISTLFFLQQNRQTVHGNI